MKAEEVDEPAQASESEQRWQRAFAALEQEVDGSTAYLSRRGVETRRRLLESAFDVFSRDGFTNARIGDIGAGAGMSSGVFYHYFETKEAAFAEIAVQALMRLYPIPGSTTRLDPIRRIETTNRQYLQNYRDQVGFLRAVEEATALSATFRAARHELSARFPARTERALTALRARGLIDPTLDLRQAALALGGMVRLYAYFWLIEGEETEFEHAVHSLTRFWVQALGLDHSLPDVYADWLAETAPGVEGAR